MFTSNPGVRRGGEISFRETFNFIVATYCRTIRAGDTLGCARAVVARFTTRTVRVVRTACHAKSGVYVARTYSVTFQNRFGTSDQRVTVESGCAAALHAVVDDLAFSAWPTSGGTVARS